MSERKTCGTCGPDGGWCEFAVYYRQEVKQLFCSLLRDVVDDQDVVDKDAIECDYHAAYREQRDAREKAEAEAAVLRETVRDQAATIKALEEVRSTVCECGIDEACRFVRERDDALDRADRLSNEVDIVCRQLIESDMMISDFEHRAEAAEARVAELTELAMDLRGYTHDWDWKNGEEWDAVLRGEQ